MCVCVCVCVCARVHVDSCMHPLHTKVEACSVALTSKCRRLDERQTPKSAAQARVEMPAWTERQNARVQSRRRRNTGENSGKAGHLPCSAGTKSLRGCWLQQSKEAQTQTQTHRHTDTQTHRHTKARITRVMQRLQKKSKATLTPLEFWKSGCASMASRSCSCAMRAWASSCNRHSRCHQQRPAFAAVVGCVGASVQGEREAAHTDTGKGSGTGTGTDSNTDTRTQAHMRCSHRTSTTASSAG